MVFSPRYVEYLKMGPFPGVIDPWAEAGRYFQQIHSGMINHMLEQIQDKALGMGYLVGKETSLQVLEGREPDIFIRREPKRIQPVERWDYAAAAIAVKAEAGEAISVDTPELESLHITEFATGTLVTVVEIISPRNKSETALMTDYRLHRARLLEDGINVVEIDATRSIRRLLDHPIIDGNPYHIAIFLPGDLPRIITSQIAESLHRFALPLRGDVIPVEAQNAYDHAYTSAAIAGHLLNEGAYSESSIPFPSTLSTAERSRFIERVTTWQSELSRLRTE